MIPPRALLLPALLGALAGPLGACTSFDDAVATQGYFDFAQATRVCARVFTCPNLAASLRQSLDAPLDDASFSQCLSWLAGPTPAPPGGFAAQSAVLDQIAAAASCDDALDALDVRVFAADPRCPIAADGHAVDVCDGGDLVDCHHDRTVRCSGPAFAAGSACAYQDKAAEVASCQSGKATDVCLKIGATCDDTTLALCEAGLTRMEELPCAAVGVGCASEATALHLQQDAFCTNSADPTTVCAGVAGDGATACTSAGELVVCNHLLTVGGTTLGGVEVAYDCKGLGAGWSCAGGGSTVAFCAPPPADAECLPAGFVSTCAGDTLAVCVAGQSTHVDCAAAGATCSDPGQGARCLYAAP